MQMAKHDYIQYADMWIYIYIGSDGKQVTYGSLKRFT